MILKKIYLKIQNKNIQRFVGNTISLIVINGIDILFPLLTMPYLIYILGVDGFGAVTFAIVIANYIIMISDYGFVLTATRKISIYRKNFKKMNNIFWTTIFIRLALGIILYTLLILVVLIIPKLNANKFIYIYTLGMIIGNALIPIWFFQGLEKMKYLTYINVITKASFTILIFIVIKNKTDYQYVTLLSSFGYLLSGIFSIYLSMKLFNLKIVVPTLRRIFFELKEGWLIFISIISISLYRNSNVLILGAFTNDMTVGYYAAAEKVIKAMQAVLNPISTALFPYLSKRFEREKISKKLSIIFKISRYYILILLPISLFISIFAQELVLVFGTHYLSSIIDLQIMGFVIFFGGLNYLYGINGMINMGFKKEFTKFVLISGIFSISITTLLSPIYFDKAASFSLLFSELLLFLLVLIYLMKIKIKQN